MGYSVIAEIVIVSESASNTISEALIDFHSQTGTKSGSHLSL